MPTDTLEQDVLTPEEIPGVVQEECSPEQLEVDDEHTHLLFHTAGFELCYFGIVRMLTYHYVRRILFAEKHVSPKVFYGWDLKKQAEFVWEKLFVNRLEDCTDEGRKGVILVMQYFGLDVNAPTLKEVFEFYNDQTAAQIIELSCKAAGVKRVVGTQDFFNDAERAHYLTGDCGFDSRMRAAIRLDEITLHWKRAVPKLHELGCSVTENSSDSGNHTKLRKLLDEWFVRFGDPAYAASSFGPKIRVNDINTDTGIILDKVVLPFCKDHNLPFFMMPGPIRGLKPEWRDAGDGVGICDMSPYQDLVASHPENNFLITPLHSANQYDASVMTCHNDNLQAIGHWWFNLTPAQVEQVLKMRLELTGCRFIAFNSDARVWENLINKWLRFREILAKVITEQQLELQKLGVKVTRKGIRRAVRRLFEMDFSHAA